MAETMIPLLNLTKDELEEILSLIDAPQNNHMAPAFWEVITDYLLTGKQVEIGGMSFKSIPDIIEWLRA